MNDGDVDDGGFAPPPFKPEQALPGLQRELRALGLAERGGVFERRGLAIARAAVDGQVLRVARVRRPSRQSPEWLPSTLKDAAQLRHFVADLKRQLATWTNQDE